ncbi:hypothetical protein BDW66DRAFT_154887 [Aspergillus desertorum]
MSYALSTPTLSQYSTPYQTPRCSSPSSDSPRIETPQVVDVDKSDIFAQEPFRLIDSGEGPVLRLLAFLGHYSRKMERRERQRLAEQRRNDETVKRRLQNKRGSAPSGIDGQQTLAITYREELEAEIAKNELLAGKAQALERQLAEEQVKSNRLENQLAERAAQLSVAATHYSRKEDILSSILSHLAKNENENNELREQLKERNQQLDRKRASIAEERTKSDRILAKLTFLSNQLAAEQSQRSAVEHQLNERDKTLTRINSELVKTRARNSELHLELAEARTEAEPVDTLRSANEGLEAKCETLRKEASDLHDLCRHHECKIKDLEEQQRTMRAQVDRLNSEIQDEQKRSTELRAAVSDLEHELEHERDEFNIQLRRLQDEHDNLTNANAAVQRAKIGLRVRILALQARCGSLNAEVAKLKSIASQQSEAETKPPRRPAIIRYRYSSSKLIIKVIVEKFHADVHLVFPADLQMQSEVRFSPRSRRPTFKPGDTILHYLAQGGRWWHQGAIKYLLEHGADPNARSKHGNAPLCQQSRYGIWEDTVSWKSLASC